MAGRTLLRAREQQDFSTSSLNYYTSLLQDSFVWKDHETFQNMPNFLSNPRLYEDYPVLVSELFEHLLWIGDQPKEKLSKTVFRTLRKNLLNLDVIRDLLKFRRI